MSTRLRDLDDDLGAAFRSAQADAPSPQAKAALLGALGLGAATLAAGAGAGSAAGAAGAGSVAAKTAGTFVALKWIVASAVIVSAAATTVHVVTAPAPQVTPALAVTVTSPPLTTARAESVAPVTAAPVVKDVATSEPLEAPLTAAPVARAIDVAALPSAPPASAPVPAPAPLAVTTTPAPTAVLAASEPRETRDARDPAPAQDRGPAQDRAPTPRRATVADEIAKLDEARALLRAGRGADAAAAIAEYRRSFPSGTLAEEAAVLEIESLANAGQRERAGALGSRFVAAHPTSPLVPRVRRAIGSAPP